MIFIGTGITMFNWNRSNSSKNPGVTLAAVLDEEETGEAAMQEHAIDMAEFRTPRAAVEDRADSASGDGVEESLIWYVEGSIQEEEEVSEKAAAGAAETEPEEHFFAVTDSGSEQKEGFSVVYGTRDTEDGAWEELVVVEMYTSWEEVGEAYYLRLSEMDRKLSEKMEEAAKKPVADQKTVADETLKFWDDELNAVYQALREELEEEAFYALREEERAWLRARDEAAAQAAAAENSSNSSQNLAYTLSLVSSTRDRVYVLAEMYYGEDSK